AANLYRFGASQATHEIVEERLNTLSETPVPGYYLPQNLKPALQRICTGLAQARLLMKLLRKG
ncbi:DUF3422 domain-containing protein, partial [Escherichia coli]